MRKVGQCMPPLPRTSHRLYHVCFMGFMHHNRRDMLEALQRLQEALPWLKIRTVKTAHFGSWAVALCFCGWGGKVATMTVPLDPQP